MSTSGATQPTQRHSCAAEPTMAAVSRSNRANSTSDHSHRSDSSPHLEELAHFPLSKGFSRCLETLLRSRYQDCIGQYPITSTRPAPTNFGLKLTEQLVGTAEWDSLRLSCSNHEA